MGCGLSDSALFISGSLFTTDYLVEAVTITPAYAAVDVTALRARLAGIAAAFPKNSRTNESQTEDDFIWPVLASLGWTESLRQQNLTVSGRDDVPDGLLFADAAAKAAANAHGDQWKRYEHGLAVVESKRWARPLDRASGRDEATAPSTQMLRYLRRIDDLTSGRLRWGVLTNGTKWRLYWAGARSVSEEFLEVDLGRVLALEDSNDLFASDAVRDHWLRVFAVMFSRNAFVKDGADSRSFHERARAAAAFYEERVAASLSKLVFEQVFPSLATAIANAAPHAPLQNVREASLVLLYRLLFLLYAEDRDLLPVSDRRYDDYALRPLRIDVGKRLSEGDALSASASRIWSHIADLSRIVDKGDPSVGIPPYNGGLFATDGPSLLESVRIPDSVMAPALDALSYERSSGERRYINYRDLSVQQLGSIYERLLEFEIVRDEVGSLVIRPNLFARKNSGSYYTPDELVGLILDETLEPLISERLDAFRATLLNLTSEQPEDQRRRELRDVDPATSILTLRICDPAMGSGHFLVSLVDALADHVLNAMAEAASLGADLAYTSPLAEKIEDVRATILKNAKAAKWTIDETQLDDRHIVRRMVLKKCIFGVDKNPMAVELAKVSLWLHTFTVGAPLSFIDHHLRSGDSLFGLWVRDAIDKAGRLGGELLWSEALRNAQRSAEAMKTIETLTDAEIAEAHRSAAMYQDVELMTGELDGFVSFIHALDWLRLSAVEMGLVRLWLDGRFGDPLPIARGKKAPEAGRAKAEEVEAFRTVWVRARQLIEEERFLNWQISFPGVWERWTDKNREGGFDAVVGNPPWDRIKLQQVEWFAARRPEIALAQRASDRSRMISGLKATGDPLWADFAHADARAADAARMTRSSGHFPLLSRGDINLYSLFVERAFSIVKPSGVVGLLVPSGIASDLSASVFFRDLAVGSRLKGFYDFENRRARFGLPSFFPDVDGRFKFAALIASPGRTFESARCGFFLQSPSETTDPDIVFSITAGDFARVNPNTGTAPIFRTRRDMALTTAIYERLPVLVDRRSSQPTTVWPVRYVRMFDMTNDSRLFRTRSELLEREAAWEIGQKQFQSPSGKWVPLYEGKMVQAFDHRAASVTINPENVKRPAQPLETSLAQHQNPEWLPEPQFWVAAQGVEPKGQWHLGMKHVTSATNVRSMIVSIIPEAGAGNSLPILDVGGNVRVAAMLAGMMNSIPFDFVLRQKVQGQNLNWFIVEQLPFVSPDMLEVKFGGQKASSILIKAVLELTYTSCDLAPFAQQLGWVKEDGSTAPPFIWDEERRAHLRAKLDALFFIIFGLMSSATSESDRENIRYIFSTFSTLEREETAKWGYYRGRDLTLAWVNALLAGQPDGPVHG